MASLVSGDGSLAPTTLRRERSAHAVLGDVDPSFSFWQYSMVTQER